MDEISKDIISDGRRFVLDQLRLGEDQLRLIGKLVRLKTDEKVDFMHYSPGYHFYIRFKEVVSVLNFEKLLERYEIPREYSKVTNIEAVLRPLGPESIEVLFEPVK